MRRNIYGFKSEKRKVYTQGQGSVVFQSDYTWSHHNKYHRQICIDVTTCSCLLAQEWNPQNVCVPKRFCTVEEEISRKIGAVMTEGGTPALVSPDSDSDSVYQIYDIGAMTSRMIFSVKVALIKSRNVSKTKATVQNMPQAKKFQSKGREEMS